MLYYLEHEGLRVAVSSDGAELRSLFDKVQEREYIWQRDATYWAKSSPILFPVIGELIDGRYLYEGNTYQMPKHGFARDMPFRLIHQDEQQLRFSLCADKRTKQIYPFDFELIVQYTLLAQGLTVRYEVRNRDTVPMYFSIGGHPAFQLDLSDGQQWTDYSLLFDKDDILFRYYLKKGLLHPEPESIHIERSELPLTLGMFDQDAWVLDRLLSKRVLLRNRRGDYRLSFEFDGFTQFGLWAPKDAPFICLEPWCGVNDLEGHLGRLQDKYDIQTLAADMVFQASWTMEVNC